MIIAYLAGIFLLSILLATVIIPRILFISYKKRLFDVPDSRKVHKTPIPRLGGLSFLPVILIALCSVTGIRYYTNHPVDMLWASDLFIQYLFLIVGLTLLYLVGVADDLVGVGYRYKFVIQILAALLFPLSGLWINDLGGLLGLHEIPAYIGMPLTVFLTVYITNAINLIDGIDGLASGLSSVALLVFGFLFMQKELWTYSMLAFATFGVLVPFFYYNVFGSAERARKIFMGDTGSLTLGYVLSFLAIKYSQYNPDVTPYTEGAFVIAFSTLIVPAFDVIRVVMVRVRSGKSPFEPDKNHIHHKFLAMGFTPRKAMITILLISCAFSAVNILLVPVIDNTVMLLADIAVWVGLNLWFDRVRDKKQK